ncbi:hypothetical protein HLH44_19870 [Gluconacetobacter sp. 1c LMG 22058]|uniref:Uncharacterized protein n=1 Tax=Gluconacetobacter dulcium TaxID=2729096 RepID=A0A7W4PIU5_9PROT|nr:hypothetical protein [Gluconacetobacter dulcium]MBB2199657.1 hypothetical protein [Gluconacetobacter dulcium]
MHIFEINGSDQAKGLKHFLWELGSFPKTETRLSHIDEAVACGFGFRTHAALRASFSGGAITAVLNEDAFANRLCSLQTHATHAEPAKKLFRLAAFFLLDERLEGNRAGSSRRDQLIAPLGGDEPPKVRVWRTIVNLIEGDNLSLIRFDLFRPMGYAIAVPYLHFVGQQEAKVPIEISQRIRDMLYEEEEFCAAHPEISFDKDRVFPGINQAYKENVDFNIRSDADRMLLEKQILKGEPGIANLYEGYVLGCRKALDYRLCALRNLIEQRQRDTYSIPKLTATSIVQPMPEWLAQQYKTSSALAREQREDLLSRIA